MRHYLALAAALALLSAGCERPWQVARTVVNASAEGIAAADTAYAEAYEASDCRRTEELAELRRCVESLEAATEILRTARASALVGESLVDAWEQAGEEPEDWRSWLNTAGQLAARLTELCAELGVSVPQDIASWADLLDRYIEDRRQEE